MSRAWGLKTRLAIAVCLSALAVDFAWAQDADDGSQAAQGSTLASPDTQKQRGVKPGWLLGGQNRVVNPFRATPAPGAAPAIQNRPQAGSRPLPPGIRLPGAAASAQKLPQNATANAVGPGWTCNFGYARQGAMCVEVPVPENATVDLTGRGWMCNSGFVRQAAGCVALIIPQNASLDSTGRRWACDYGFRRQGPGCVAVVVPEHASLDKAGHAWVCNSGYQARGQACIDDATARLQQQADKAVKARPGGQVPARPSVTINSGENRQGRTNKAKVVIGRF
jgi:hypothetical protein